MAEPPRAGRDPRHATPARSVGGVPPHPEEPPPAPEATGPAARPGRHPLPGPGPGPGEHTLPAEHTLQAEHTGLAGHTRLVERLRTLRCGLRAYGLVAAMWMRSTMTYRASFAMTALANLAATSFDFAVILLMFTHVDTLAGYRLPEVALLYGAAATAFGLADLAMGSMDRLGRRVRDGTLDTLLVRPAPVLAQVAADRFALRRLGRITQGLLVLGYALLALDIAWTPLKAAVVAMMPLSGAVIFAALFVVGAAFQFVAQDAAEVQNSFTYGGSTLLQYPPTVFAKDLVRGVTFVVPLAFVNWLPALYVLGQPYPLDLPRWLAFTPPLVAAGCCALAGAAWRAGLRTYRSTGS